jgi:hypothetical protein
LEDKLSTPEDNVRDIGEKVSDLVWGERTEIVAIFDHLVPTVYKVKDTEGREYLLSEDDIVTFH